MATLLEWKKFVEGLRRIEIGPYKEDLLKQEVNVVRTYSLRNEIRASMIVENAITGNTTRTNPRTFFVNLKDIQDTSFIYIPTDEDIEQWGEDDLDVAEEIMKRETRSLNKTKNLLV